MSMCRLNRVEKARQDQGKCGKCGEPLKAGDSYRWWKGRYTGKYVRCAKPGCQPKPWELETNATRQEAMQAEALVSDAMGCEDAGTAASYVRDAISLVEGLADTLEERVSNWDGTNLEGSTQYEACQTTAESYRDWLTNADELLEAMTDLEELPELDLGA